MGFWICLQGYVCVSSECLCLCVPLLNVYVYMNGYVCKGMCVSLLNVKGMCVSLLNVKGMCVSLLNVNRALLSVCKGMCVPLLRRVFVIQRALLTGPS